MHNIFSSIFLAILSFILFWFTDTLYRPTSLTYLVDKYVFTRESVHTLHLWHITFSNVQMSKFFYYSTGSLEFCFGGDLPFKNLQTNYLETKLIMEKASRCPSIMVQTNIIMLLFHPRLGKIQIFFCWFLSSRPSPLWYYLLIAQLFSTQVPQAVGAAYSLKMDGKDACSITYFGDGGTSTVSLQMCELSKITHKFVLLGNKRKIFVMSMMIMLVSLIYVN